MPSSQPMYSAGTLEDKGALGSTQNVASNPGRHNALQQNNAFRSSKLGIIGGGRHTRGVDALDERSVSHQGLQGRQTPDRHIGSDDIETPSPSAEGNAIFSEDHHRETSPRSASLFSRSTKVKGRLGVIGGKRKVKEGEKSDKRGEAPSSPSSSYIPTNEQSAAGTSTAAIKPVTLHGGGFGELPRHHNNLSLVKEPSNSLLENARTPPRPTTPPVEDPQEKADKKRAELKKLLEGKATVPAVKKRRF